MNSRRSSTSFGVFDRHKSSPALSVGLRRTSSTSGSMVAGTTAASAAGATAPPPSEQLRRPSTAMVKKLSRAASRSSEGLRILSRKVLGNVHEESTDQTAVSASPAAAATKGEETIAKEMTKLYLTSCRFVHL
jgi:hypothetical protein